MATTLPTLTKTIDTAFVSTWYELKSEAVDNILNASVVWAALKDKGCMKTQQGGTYITRPIRYGTVATQAVKKGSVFSQGEPELKTMARWTWRYISAHVQRSLFDDQVNRGPAKIADLVKDRLGAARDALIAKFESQILGTHVTDETGDEFQGLNDIVPLQITQAVTGTYGGITRPATYVSGVAATGNTWWAPKFGMWTAPVEVNMVSDMRHMFNMLANNQVPPDLIITDQTFFELYEDFALDMSQIVKDESTKLADLGFEVMRYKGKPMIWTPNITASNMLMLTTSFIDVVYDPGMWFDMTEWKPVPLGGERIAHILSACNTACSQLRRQGRIQTASVST